MIIGRDETMGPGIIAAPISARTLASGCIIAEKSSRW